MPDLARRALFVLGWAALVAGSRAVAAEQLQSPAAQSLVGAIATTSDDQVAPAGCMEQRPSCGCADASCDCATGGKCCGPDCCQKRCVVYCEPDDYVCCAKTKQEQVEHECWTVECEAVCIPKFRFPWECCCKPKCGRVRCVNVLGKDKYECEECVTEWEAKRVRCDCPSCKKGRRCNCNDGESCEPGCGACAQAPVEHENVRTASAQTPVPARSAEKAGETDAQASWWSKWLRR